MPTELSMQRHAALDTMYANVLNWIARQNKHWSRTARLPRPQKAEVTAGHRAGSLWLWFGDYTKQALSKLDDAAVAQFVPWAVMSNDAVYTARNGQFVTITVQWPEKLQTKAIALDLPRLVVDNHHDGLIHLGVNDAGKHVNLIFDKMRPHALIAGTTGGGKTETLRTIAASLVRFPDWRLVLLSGKGVTDIDDLQHLHNSLFPVATTAQQIAAVLQHVTNKMEQRYNSNQHAHNKIVVLFDEPQEFTSDSHIAAQIGKLRRYIAIPNPVGRRTIYVDRDDIANRITQLRNPALRLCLIDNVVRIVHKGQIILCLKRRVPHKRTTRFVTVRARRTQTPHALRRYFARSIHRHPRLEDEIVGKRIPKKALTEKILVVPEESVLALELRLRHLLPRKGTDVNQCARAFEAVVSPPQLAALVIGRVITNSDVTFRETAQNGKIIQFHHISLC